MPVQTPFLSPELEQESEDVQRKRRIADALIARGLQPGEGQMLGRVYVPPNTLSGAINAIGGTLLGKKLQGQQADITARGAAQQQSELERVTRALKGGPVQTIQPDPQEAQQSADYGTPEVGPAQVQAQTPQQAIEGILPTLRTPFGQHLAQGYLGGQLGALVPKKQEPYTLKPGEQRRGPNNEIIATGPDVKPANPETNAPFTLSPGAKRIGPNGEIIADNPRSESATPYYNPVQTAQGIFAFNSRTGKMEQIADANGKPIIGAANDPRLQRELAAARAGGTETGKEQAVAQLDLPRVTANANNAIQLVDQMIGSEDNKVPPHPGFKTSVGVGMGRVEKIIPGSNAADFHALFDQVKGGAFLEAFNSLKGGGQITEIEGKKATDAITRMQTTQSEAEFIKAAREYQSVIRKGLERAQQKAGMPTDRRSQPRGSTTVVNY